MPNELDIRKHRRDTEEKGRQRTHRGRNDAGRGTGGRVVTYGATLGAVPQMTVRRVFWKQLNVLGTTMGSPEDFRGMLALVAGGLRPVVDSVLPLAEAGRALARMEQAAQFGKI